MMRIVPISRYSCLRCDLIKCVKWYVECLILHKYGKMTNILCSKDNNFLSIGLLNPKNIGADINITFLLHSILEISLLLQKSCCCGHLGGNLEFWSLHKWDSRGLLICYLWVHYGLILKKNILLRILFTSNPNALGLITMMTSPVNATHKAQWRRALMYHLIYAWTNGWANNRNASDLIRHRIHYDVIVMMVSDCIWSSIWWFMRDV